MRIARWTKLVMGAIWVAAMPATLAASDFSDQMAKWNAGSSRGAVAPAAYQAPAYDMAAETAPQPARPPAASRPGPSTTRPLAPAPHPVEYRTVPGDYYGGGSHCATCNSGGYFGHGWGHSGGMGACGCNSCGDMCGANCGGGHGGGYDVCCGKTLWWAKADLLLWWRQGSDLPPLVTSSPTAVPSTDAGVLPDARILFGGESEPSSMAAGGRIDIGFWLDPQHCRGVGNRFFGLGRDSIRYDADTFDHPILAIPFFDVDGDENNSLLIAYPGLLSGSVDIESSSTVIGNDVYFRMLLCRDCNSRLDFITGYHYSRISENLSIRSSRTVTEVGGDIPLGTETDVFDQFNTRNSFHGAILGLMHEWDCRCWTVQTLGRMSIGGMNQEVIIDGSTRIAVPGQGTNVTDGGLFTGENNLGTHSRSEFSAVTEVGVNLAYNWNPCTKLTVGYSFIYWHDVLRAGDQIDTQVGGDRPRLRMDSGDFWVQGLNLGLVREF